MMSDTYNEQMTNREVLSRVERMMKDSGSCYILISGLGLGMLLPPLLKCGADITIIENCEDVIDLVSPYYYPMEKYPAQLKVIYNDAFTWKPERGLLWDLIYHDIWYSICATNLDELTKLKRHYARRLKRPNGHQWGWEEDTLKYHERYK